jgi:L,D-peptidoglycan transpeptidase YkuD (ErfK/YbiS/YcfS/YnhG family)
LLALGLLLYACEDPRLANLEGVRAASRKAVKTAHLRFPQNAHLIERLVADAESITAAEAAAWPWDRDHDRVAAAWERVGRAAWTLTRDARTADRDEKARWIELSDGLPEDIETARQELKEGAGLGRREAIALQRAIFHAELAKREAAAKRFAKAAAAADIARQSVAVIHQASTSLHSRFDDRKLLRVWRSWVEQTIAESKRANEAAIIVDKLNRRLELYHDGHKLATFPAELGANGLKRKLHAGDKATPEGRYRVTQVRMNGATKFYKALLLSYPNAEDMARFRTAQRTGQVPLRAGIGSLIEIHGSGGQGQDWTDGCVALRNKDMDKLFQHARVGMPVTIVGTF